MWPFDALGNPLNPPLVFLHGFLGSGDDWLPIAKRFDGDFYCILPDLPGHGRWVSTQLTVNSEQSPISNLQSPISQSLTFDLLATDLISLFDHLRLPAVTLVGYSMGGRVGLYTAVHHPHRIASLVLEGASPGLLDEKARQERVRVDDERAAALLNEGIEAFVEQWYEMPLFHTLKKQPELLAKTKAKRKQNDARWMAKIISDLSPGRQPPLWDKLGSLPMPVLLVVGELDPHYASLITQMQRLIPQGTAEMVANAGHNVHLENPEVFIKLINKFVAKQGRCQW